MNMNNSGEVGGERNCSDSEEEIINEFLQDSDDSSLEWIEDTNSESKNTLFLTLCSSIAQDKRVSIPNFFEDVVPRYNEVEFVTHFRIRHSLLYSLSEKFKSSEHYIVENKGATSAEKHLCLFLWFIGHETVSYRDISNQFNLALSTVHDIIKRVSNFLVQMAPEVIKWPTFEEQDVIAASFHHDKGFPNIAGCIDGTHILIDKPCVEIPDSYINRKGDYSIQLQVICDHERNITDIFLGYPGSVHDSRVFSESDILRKCLELPDNNKYLVGDSAYPCLDFLMIPYKDNGYLTANQKRFNKKLSSCRVKVEHTIGRLKQRFRQLFHLKTRNIPLLLKQIKACCVLHNLGTEEDFEIVGEPTEEAEEEPGEYNFDLNGLNANKERGKLLRNMICEQLQ